MTFENWTKLQTIASTPLQTKQYSPPYPP